MTITMAFCSECGRQVHLSNEDTLSCPVCSTPLLETLDAAEDPITISYPPGAVGPDTYLG